jgi:hypothetical protein
MSIFNLTAPPGPTQNEILARVGPAGVIWAAKRAPWFHLSTANSTCTGKAISTGTWWWQGPSKRPNITITQIQIKKQGEFGTTRRAIVTMKAYRDADLINTLQECYFIPGMSVRLQWGWSLACGPKGLPAGAPLTDMTLTDNEANCKMRELASASPIYDGLQGLVTNFGYSLDADGNWDCTLEIVAPSSVAFDSKTQYACCKDCKTAITDSNILSSFLRRGPDPNEYEKNKGALFGALLKLADNEDVTVQQANIGKMINKIQAFGYSGADCIITAYRGPDRTPDGSESDQSIWSFGRYGTNESYINWRMLEGMVTLFSFPSDNGAPTLVKIDSGTDIKIQYPKNVWIESSDPRVCLLPGSNAFTGGGGLPKPVHENSSENFRVSSVASALVGTEVNWCNVMINTSYLLQELDAVQKADGTVETFLRNIMRKVNECIGSVGNLDLISLDAADCSANNKVSTLKVIDLKQATAAAVYLLPAIPAGSAARSLKLELKLTEAMKTQALYSNADRGSSQTDNTCNTVSDPCTNYAFKPFGLAKNSTLINSAARDGNMTGGCKACQDMNDNAPGKTPAPDFRGFVTNMIDCVEDSTCNALNTALLREIRAAVEADSTNACKHVMLPFNFEFTVDGVGGFAWGQAVSSNRIPKGVRDSFYFQITAVEHTITHNDWTTTVQTVARWRG